MIEKAIVKFEDYTKYPLSKYLDECGAFFQNSFPLIADYFNGKSKKVESKHLNEHKRLLKESDKVNEQFKNNSQKLKTVDFWLLIDFCEELRTKLQTTSKLSKYLRSSRTDFSFSNGFAHPYTMGNEQTMESISEVILQDLTSEDDWTNIALQNDLKEVQWEIDGGTKLTLFRERFIQNFVTSVIDNMIGEKIYGLDIQKKFEFENDDLKVLSYKDTAIQTVNILANLKKGDIPEFKDLGVNAGLYVGSNIANLAYSSIVREITKVFASDDLFINFQIKEIKLKEDAFFISFQIETKYKLLVQSTALI